MLVVESKGITRSNKLDEVAKDKQVRGMNIMNAKYRMAVEQNIFVAKRNIIDYIWKSAVLEGLTVTYQDTKAIINGVSAPNVKVSEIVAVNNLKLAWCNFMKRMIWSL